MSELEVDMSGITFNGVFTGPPINIRFDIDGSAPLVMLPPNDPSDACRGGSPVMSNFSATIGTVHYSGLNGPAIFQTYPSDCQSVQATLLSIGDPSGAVGHFFG